MRNLWMVGGAVLALGVLSGPVAARTQYKTVILKMEPANDLEKDVQARVKADNCNSCHVKDKPKEVCNDFGTKLKGLLPKFEKESWSEGKLETATKEFREALNKVK